VVPVSTVHCKNRVGRFQPEKFARLLVNVVVLTNNRLVREKLDDFSEGFGAIQQRAEVEGALRRLNADGIWNN